MRLFLLLLTTLWLGACTSPQSEFDAQSNAATAPAQTYVEGRDYSVLEQQIIDAPEVIELFFYGCEACYYVAEGLANWSAEKDIQLVMVPAHNEQQFVTAARLFHTLDSMGRNDLQLEAYKLHHEPSELEGEERINAMLDAHDVERNAFWSVWGSDVINQRLNGSYALNAMLATNVTPTFIVHGKYRVEVDTIREQADLFTLLEHLVALEG